MKKTINLAILACLFLLMQACSNIAQPKFDGGVNMDFDASDPGMIYK